MQSTAVQSELQNGFSASHSRRSASGASTHSHESSVTNDLSYSQDARYAPIRPMSQPIGQPQEGFPVAVQNFDGDGSGLHQIHQYNNSQGPIVHPHVAAFHGQQSHFGPYDGQMPTGFHAMSEAPSDSRPASRQRQGSVSLSASQGPANGTDPDARAKKNASANAANERELRELIEKNSSRSLESIAKDVRGAEKTQKAERAKQLFAMRWLREYCRHDKESVPRNRVYTYYTQRCGSERVDTLNPASFGKLVRVIFPGIATRRLGVRGESKYHYVNLALTDDPVARGAAQPRPQSAGDTSMTATDREQSFAPEASTASFSKSVADSSLFQPHQSMPPQSMPLVLDMPMEQSPPNPPSKGQIFAEPSSHGFRHDFEGPQMYTQSLRFSAAPDSAIANGALDIPDIKPFLPAGADPDLGENLEALYRTHCTSLIDAVRYVREKSFFKLLSAFNGQMTVPVAKLFQHPDLTPWIRQCDTIMYQQIVRFVSQLALQVIPPQVFTMLGNVSNELSRHMRANFKNYPEHVLQAKLEPGRVFTCLLQRLLRVNETAHAAANLLMNDQMRNLMWQDWVRSVKPKRVIESELYGCGEEETYNILTQEVRSLLEPLPLTDFLEAGVDFEDDIFSSSTNRHGLLSADGILERWAVFLRSLPARYPKASTRMMLQYVNAISTAVLRDITVNQCQSFGCWWITKVWIDEMMHWLAEMGGFLDEHPVSTSTVVAADEEMSDGLPEFHQSSKSKGRPGIGRSQSTAGLGLDFNSMPTFDPPQIPDRPSSGPPTATFRVPPTTNKTISKHDPLGFDFNDQHEDSGIGMSLLDEPGHSFNNENQVIHDDFGSLLR